MQRLFLYGVPGKVGGAATKIRDLLRMLRNDFDITVVLGHLGCLKDREVTSFLEKLGLKYCLRKEVPDRVEAVALGICELDFFISGSAAAIKRKGMKLVWANCMMWEFNGEADAVRQNLVDLVLFNSEIQREAFAKLYAGVPQFLIRNYITPEDFPYAERRNPVFTIGRLSRPDPVKFPADFPVFYEELGFVGIRGFRRDRAASCKSFHRSLSASWREAAACRPSNSGSFVRLTVCLSGLLQHENSRSDRRHRRPDGAARGCGRVSPQSSVLPCVSPAGRTEQKKRTGVI